MDLVVQKWFDWDLPASTASAVGAAAITEGADVAAGTGGVSVAGIAAVAESQDTPAGTGVVSVTGAAAITEGADVAAGTGGVSVAGVAAITEGADIAAGTGTESVSGVAAITESSDVAAGVGSAGNTGSGAVLESADIASGAGTDESDGIAAILESSDSANGVGTGNSVTPYTPTPAGRRVRNIFRVRVDGHRFEFTSLSQALQFLENAKERAAILANEAIAKAAQGGDFPNLKRPEIIISSRELRPALSQVKQEIDLLYERARRDAEIAIIMRTKYLEEQEDGLLILLM